MIANYQQPGSAIDYPNGTSSAIAAGQVVSLTTRIGVAGTDIPASAVGSLYVKGVFAMPKAASTAIRHRRRRLLRRLRRHHHHDRCKQHPRRLGYCSSR